MTITFFKARSTLERKATTEVSVRRAAADEENMGAELFSDKSYSSRLRMRDRLPL